MKKNKGKWIVGIIGVIIFPIVCMYILNFAIEWVCLAFDKMLRYTNIPVMRIDISNTITLGGYIEYYFTIIGIIVTSLLSWALWKTSVESNILSKAIKDKEDNRDNDKIKESAMVVYYDLLSKIIIFKNLYVKYSLQKQVDAIDFVDINPEWIKNISQLRSFLTKKEIDILFELYEEILSLQKALEDKDEEIIKKIISKIADKLFINVLTPYLWMDFSGKTDAVLSSKYYIILRKIEAKLNNEIEFLEELQNGNTKILQDNLAVKICGSIESGVLKEGTDIYYDDEGLVVYSLEYKDFKIIKGEFSTTLNKCRELIFEGSFNGDNIENGYIIEFYPSGNIKYRGIIKNTKYEGLGTLYKDKFKEIEMFKGEWKDGKKVKGEFTDINSNTIQYFKGEYKNKREFKGEIQVAPLYDYKGIYEFKGTIVEGEPQEGSGYSKNTSYIDTEYVERHIGDWECMEYLQDDMDYPDEYYEQQDNIPDDVRQEWIEESARDDIRRSKRDLQEICIEVVELIKVDCVQGKQVKYKDDELNKKYFGRGHKKEHG